MAGYQQLIAHLIPILRSNLDHEDLTNQLLNFVQTTLNVLGA